MKHGMKLEMVVTRAGVVDVDFDKALTHLREIRDFAAARGLVQHFAIAIYDQGPEPEEKN